MANDHTTWAQVAEQLIWVLCEHIKLHDWLVPEEPEAPAGDGEPWPQSYQQRSDAMWEQRQALRALLTAEADRAERGE